MSLKLAITTSSFGQNDDKPLRILKQKKFELIFNTLGRTLRNDEVIDLLKSCPAVIAGTENYNVQVLSQLPDLRLISRCGVGTDTIDLELCKKRGIKVLTTPDAPTRAVAELVLTMGLCLLKNIKQMDDDIRQHRWQKKMGELFLGKKIGVIGFGRTGKEVARLSHVLGANVFFVDPFIKGKNRFSFAKKTTFENLLRTCDIISLHLPFTESNYHLIGVKQLALLKKNAILINCSRGGIVDEHALYRVLKDGRLAGVGLDVFEQEPYQGPLVEFDNVILTPHIGSYAREARINMETEAVTNLIQGLRSLKKK